MNETVTYTGLAKELHHAGRAVSADISVCLSDHAESEYITSLRGPDGWGAFTSDEIARLTEAVQAVVARHGMRIAKSGVCRDGSPWWETDRSRYTA